MSTSFLPIESLATGGSTVRGLRIDCVDVFFGEQGGKYPDGNQVIVRGSDSTALFDTPMVANRIPAEIVPADLVILGHMHEDHTAGLHLLPRVPVHVPQADLSAIQSLEGLGRHYGYSPCVTDAIVARAQESFHFKPRPNAKGYADGATWDLGNASVRAIHMPGHTGGHSVLLIEPLGIAFIGDIDLSGFGPYYGDACSSLQEFRRTLALMKDVPASVWITSHHKGVITEHDRFLDLLRQFSAAIDRREEALLAALSAQPLTLDQLVAKRFVYPASFNDIYVVDVERRMIFQHLDGLLSESRVSRQGDLYWAS